MITILPKQGFKVVEKIDEGIVDFNNLEEGHLKEVVRALLSSNNKPIHKVKVKIKGYRDFLIEKTVYVTLSNVEEEEAGAVKTHIKDELIVKEMKLENQTFGELIIFGTLYI